MDIIPEWEKKERKTIKVIIFCMSFFCFLLATLVMFCLFYSCTLSFQNISTHGTATDLVDEEQAASPSTNATIPINISPIPKA